jgi:RNA polymerase sigma-70 factor (ECF subfamily)
MPQLAEVYRSAVVPAPGPGRGPAPADLESTLVALCERGRAAHPGLPLDDAAFVVHLARCGASVEAGSGAVFAEDLFLACAALAGIPAAVEQLRLVHHAVIAAYLRPLDVPADLVDDVVQLVWSKLLAGDAASPPRLVGYAGKGALAGFVGVSAQRLALTLLRRRAADGRARAVMRATPEAAGAGADAELAFIKGRYRAGFQEAFRDALALFDDRERMIFRMQVVDGVSADRIGKVYGVNRATVWRWLARAREKVIAEARRLLRERMLMPDAEFESVAGLMVSQLDVSVSRILGRQ